MQAHFYEVMKINHCSYLKASREETEEEFCISKWLSYWRWSHGQLNNEVYVLWRDPSMCKSCMHDIWNTQENCCWEDGVLYLSEIRPRISKLEGNGEMCKFSEKALCLTVPKCREVSQDVNMRSRISFAIDVKYAVFQGRTAAICVIAWSVVEYDAVSFFLFCL